MAYRNPYKLINNEVYNDSFFLEIIPFSKWVSTNAIPLTAIVSSIIAFFAVYLQFKNSKDTRKHMNQQIKILESELELSKDKMVIELRPWIYKCQEKGIEEYLVRPGITKMTLRFENFGKTPALNVKFSSKVIVFNPLENKEFFYKDMFDFESDSRSGNLGHLMPNQIIPTAFEYEIDKKGVLILIEFKYSYYVDKNGTYRMAVKVLNETTSPAQILVEYDDAT